MVVSSVPEVGLAQRRAQAEQDWLISHNTTLAGELNALKKLPTLEEKYVSNIYMYLTRLVESSIPVLCCNFGIEVLSCFNYLGFRLSMLSHMLACYQHSHSRTNLSKFPLGSRTFQLDCQAKFLSELEPASVKDLPFLGLDAGDWCSEHVASYSAS